MEAEDTVKKIMGEAERTASQLARDTEGNFKHADIATIFEDARCAIFYAGQREGRKEVVEWINRCAIFTAEEAKEGDKYTYLGSYILKWGKEVDPSYGFAPFDECPEWQAKLKEWGIAP